MKKYFKPILFLVAAFTIALGTMGQQKEDELARLKKQKEAERRKKLEEIAYTKKILEETQNKKSQSLSALQALNKQIKNRKELIETFKDEITTIDQEIELRQKWIDTLEDELTELKKEYAQVIYNSYKNKNQYTTITMIFSSKTFNQALRRIKYIQAITNFRKEQVALIKEKKAALTQNIEELTLSKTDKTTLVIMQEGEKTKLENDKGQENTILITLKSKERKLRADLKAKQKAVDKLDKKIQEIIKQEIAEAARKERERIERERKKKEAEGAPPAAPKTAESTMTPEAIKLSADFLSNKGRLPWPVANGFISQGYGKHQHPTLRNVTTENNGIDITTTKGTKARAVFSGKVSAIIPIPGLGKTILINHGEFFTVYSNLATTNVTPNDPVTLKQEIGMVDTNEEGKTAIHFELWKGTEKQDPALWLYKN